MEWEAPRYATLKYTHDKVMGQSIMHGIIDIPNPYFLWDRFHSCLQINIFFYSKTCPFHFIYHLLIFLLEIHSFCFFIIYTIYYCYFSRIHLKLAFQKRLVECLCFGVPS